MAKAVKFGNDTYVDSSGVVNNRKELIDILYPVGSVYLSVNATSPQVLFGGTWSQIAERFLYCDISSKRLGGSNTHTLTINEMPTHTHNYEAYIDKDPLGGYDKVIVYGNPADTQYYTFSVTNSGGGQPHNNMPAYFTVYCWYRLS